MIWKWIEQRKNVFELSIKLFEFNNNKTSECKYSFWLIKFQLESRSFIRRRFIQRWTSFKILIQTKLWKISIPFSLRMRKVWIWKAHQVIQISHTWKKIRTFEWFLRHSVYKDISNWPWICFQHLSARRRTSFQTLRNLQSHQARPYIEIIFLRRFYILFLTTKRMTKLFLLRKLSSTRTKRDNNHSNGILSMCLIKYQWNFKSLI